MGRSIKKGPFVDERLGLKIQKLNETGSNTVIKTWSRNSVILPNFVGLTISVHNGRKFLPIYITESMVGHKLGEFAATRFYKGHKVDKKVAQKK